MDVSEILNMVLGGGVATLLTAVATLRSKVKKSQSEADKARAEAQKAQAESDAAELDNAERASQILMESVVKPLKDELNETRKDLQATKREMARLRKAIESANSCKHHDDCPVLNGMRNQGEDRRADRRGSGDGDHGQPGDGNAAHAAIDYTDGQRDTDDTHRQPADAATPQQLQGKERKG